MVGMKRRGEADRGERAEVESVKRRIKDLTMQVHIEPHAVA